MKLESNRGGINANKGYNYQDAFITAQVPSWLADPSFIYLLKEGSSGCDVEACFKDGGATKRYFYEVKNHHITPSECRDVLIRFHDKDTEFKECYTKFILACRNLGEAAKSLRLALESLQRVLPIEEIKNLKIKEEDVERCANKIGLNVPLAFLRQKVFFDTDLGDMTSDQRLCDQFIGSIVGKHSKWAAVGGLALTSAYRDIAHLINVSIDAALSREQLEQEIQNAINLFTSHSRQAGVRVRLYHWEDKAFHIAQEGDIFLDWSEHFDRKTRKVPEPSTWRDRLIPDLEKEQERVRASTDSRLICFQPSACLSAGIALGWAFREVKGYTFEFQQGPDTWRSDLQPSPERFLAVSKKEDLNSPGDLCVEISQQVDITTKVDDFIWHYRTKFCARVPLVPDLYTFGERIDCQTALAFALTAKKLIREAVAEYRCDTVHLFYAGPLGLAIFLGRLFNAMGVDIQCYEEQNENGYAPSCLLDAR